MLDLMTDIHAGLCRVWTQMDVDARLQKRSCSNICRASMQGCHEGACEASMREYPFHLGITRSLHLVVWCEDAAMVSFAAFLF